MSILEDPLWRDVIEVVARRRGGGPVVVPRPLMAVIDGGLLDEEPTAAHVDLPDLIVVYKPCLRAMERGFLKCVVATRPPIFANPVFVVYGRSGHAPEAFNAADVEGLQDHIRELDESDAAATDDRDPAPAITLRCHAEEVLRRAAAQVRAIDADLPLLLELGPEEPRGAFPPLNATATGVGRAPAVQRLRRAARALGLRPAWRLTRAGLRRIRRFVKAVRSGSEKALGPHSPSPARAVAEPPVLRFGASGLPLRADDRFAVALMLQTAFLGGVWEASVRMARQLAAINAERGRLDLTLVLRPEQENRERLADIGERLRIVEGRVDCNAFRSWPTVDRGRGFQILTADDGWPDAFFFLQDRFGAPLDCASPYGLIIHDMIQRHAPEAFDGFFFRVIEAHGMWPSVRRAAAVVATTEATAAEICGFFQIPRARVQVAPVSCEPQQRFAAVPADGAGLPEGPVILNITNASPHKGLRELLVAYGRLNAVRRDLPPLVVCGFDTNKLAPGPQSLNVHPSSRDLKRLAAELGLVEGAEVLFLGYVDESRLKALFERAAVVVNAARYDNGSYSLVEGHWFGAQVVSCRYPAAEEMARRFRLPVHFADQPWVDGLASALAAALAAPPTTAAGRAAARASLADPELRDRRQAEQIYDVLIRLGLRGRLTRLARGQAVGSAA